MTNFDRITETLEALAAFLGALPVLDAPWDSAFQLKYCTSCKAENCDAENCPHQAQRNNPAWYLTLEVGSCGNDPVR